MSNKTAGQTELTGLMKKYRWLISLLACIHLLAVFAEPFRFFSQSTVKPTAEDAGFLRSRLAPYVEFMYLSHGYAFFAPNPGPSHLLKSEMKLDAHDTLSPLALSRPGGFAASGRVESNVLPPAMSSTRGGEDAGVEGKQFLEDLMLRVFPDRNKDRPRLLYHRYFMLSEFYHNLFAPVKLSEADLQEPGCANAGSLIDVYTNNSKLPFAADCRKNMEQSRSSFAELNMHFPVVNKF